MRQQILVMLGTDGRARLPSSDRGAVGLAISELEGTVIACTRTADTEASRYAAAAGVEQFFAPEGLEGCEFDVALVGRGACQDAGDAGDLLPAILAERSGAALAYEVIDVRQRADGLEVTRDLGHGARDILLVRGRAVLVIADTARRMGYVSRRRRLAASVAQAKASATSELAWQRTTPRVRLGDHAAKVQGSATTRMNELLGVGASIDKDTNVVTGSPETCARHLLRYLVHHDFLELDMDDATEPVTEAPAPIEPRAPRPARERRSERRRPQRITEQGQKP